MLGGIEEIGSDHGVAFNPLKLDAVSFQNGPFVFDILPDLLQGLILQERFQLLQGQERGSC